MQLDSVVKSTSSVWKYFNDIIYFLKVLLSMDKVGKTCSYLSDLNYLCEL